MPIMQRDRPSVDARSLGCACDTCPLRDRKPVPPDVRPSKLVLVKEFPDSAEDSDGKLLVGKTGRWLGGKLEEIGLRRDMVHVTTAVLCTPLHKMTKATWAQAVKACSPRLRTEIGTGRVVFAMGEQAYRGVGGRAEVFNKWRGAITEVGGNVVIPYNPPAFSAFYQPWHADNFVRMLYRAAVLASGQFLEWVWPREVLYPTPEAMEVLERLRNSNLPIGLDIENRFDGTITAIGLSNVNEGVCLPWEPYYVGSDRVSGVLDYGPVGSKCRDLVLDIIEKPFPKVLQNGTHDQLYLFRKGIWMEGFVRDTLLESVVINQRLPHDLGYLAAMEFPVNPWKAEFHESTLVKSSEDMNDLPEEELRRYCLRDAFATTKLDEVLYRQLVQLDAEDDVGLNPAPARRQKRLEDLHAKAIEGMQMRFYGVPVDSQALAKHRHFEEFGMSWAGGMAGILARDAGYYQYLEAKWLKAKPKNWKKKWGEITAESVSRHFPFNPGSDDQVARMIYGVFKIPATHYTDGGVPSTNDKALTEAMEWPGPVKVFSQAVLTYRYHQKRITTYLDNLEGKARIHPIWKFHGAVTGRGSAGLESANKRGFSLQTIPKDLRNIFLAEDGCWLLAPDYAAAELRIIAVLANDRSLLEAFRRGEDIHLANARALFKKPDLDKTTEEGSKLRNGAKIVFGFNYGIDPRAAWERLRADGNTVSEEFVRWIHHRWFELHPEITIWQNETLAKARKDMYIQLPISGRRIELFGEPERDIKVTDTSNYPVQGTLPDIIDPAFRRICKEIGWSRERHMVAHVHDELVLCTNRPKEDAEIMKREMSYTFTYLDRSVDLVVEFKIGKNWGPWHKVRNPLGMRELKFEDIQAGRF